MMNSNRYLAFVLGASVVVVLLLGSVGYLSPRTSEPAPAGETPPAPSSSPSLIPAQQTPLTPPPPAITTPNSSKPVPASSSTSLPESSAELPAEWKTYRDEQYKFEIHYPSKGFLLTSKMGAPFRVHSHIPLQEPINLYRQRAVPTEGPISAPMTIAVYKKPSTALMQWLSAGYGMDLLNIQRGGIDTTLARAYAGETGVLSYTEYQKKGESIYVYEIGVAWSNSYAIDYATFFVNEELSYIYEISFMLPYYSPSSNAKPSDGEYMDLQEGSCDKT